MIREKRNPAVVAGLLGVVTFAAPKVALAISPDMGLIGSPFAQFVIGCATGSIVTGVACALAIHASRVRELRDLEGGTLQATSSLMRQGTASCVTATSQGAADDTSRLSRDPGVRHDHVAAGHIATDYEDVAENYVRRETFRERMASRARGVADVLSERLGASRFDDLPVIERADGSVGDVGTGWWEARVGGSVRHVGDRTDLAGELAVPSWMGDVSPQPQTSRSQARPGADVAPRPREAVCPQPSHAAVIARRVAEVDQGKYPARRTSAELDHDDMWDAALAAMGERIDQMQSSPVFHDTVGGVDSIDEPEGLESPTRFIPFRTPAGHPEVVDTESYVDYLIGEEFSRNSSQAVRRQSREYLRVLRGGSQDLRATARHRTVRSGDYRPRHMAVPTAREA